MPEFDAPLAEILLSVGPRGLILGTFFAILMSVAGGFFVIDQFWRMFGWRGGYFCDERRPHSWSAKVVGGLEAGLFALAVAVNQGGFIAVWLALKVAGQWVRWERGYQAQEEVLRVEGRAIYNVFLIGTALTVLYGGSGGIMAQLLSQANDWPAAALHIAVSLTTLGLAVLARTFLRHHRVESRSASR